MRTALALSFLAIIEGYGMAGKRAVVAAFLFLVSACGGGGGGAGSGGTATLGSGKLVFVSGRTGNPEVYVADSSGQQNVTNDPGYDTDAKFSPDGTRIVFGIPFKLHRMNADGPGIAQLTSTPSWEGEFSPSFSADGSRIAYHGSTDGST
jgi:hypothetical protein